MPVNYIDVSITARYQETDRMGIIHHSVYPVWFEVARTELIKTCGHPYSELEKKGLLLPLFRLETDYIRPVSYEDTVRVRCRIDKLTKTRIILQYEICGDSPDTDEMILICRGFTYHAFTDRNLKPLNISKEFPEVYEALALFCDEKD